MSLFQFQNFAIFDIDISPCVEEPCANNGTCIRLGMTQNFTCICLSGYTGDRCQTGKYKFYSLLSYVMNQISHSRHQLLLIKDPFYNSSDYFV